MDYLGARNHGTRQLLARHAPCSIRKIYFFSDFVKRKAFTGRRRALAFCPPRPERDILPRSCREEEKKKPRRTEGGESKAREERSRGKKRPGKHRVPGICPDWDSNGAQSP